MPFCGEKYRRRANGCTGHCEQAAENRSEEKAAGERRDERTGQRKGDHRDVGEHINEGGKRPVLHHPCGECLTIIAQCIERHIAIETEREEGAEAGQQHQQRQEAFEDAAPALRFRHSLFSGFCTSFSDQS